MGNGYDMVIPIAVCQGYGQHWSNITQHCQGLKCVQYCVYLSVSDRHGGIVWESIRNRPQKQLVREHLASRLSSLSYCGLKSEICAPELISI